MSSFKSLFSLNFPMDWPFKLLCFSRFFYESDMFLNLGELATCSYSLSIPEMSSTSMMCSFNSYETSMPECYLRDANRKQKVGSRVLRFFHDQIQELLECDLVLNLLEQLIDGEIVLLLVGIGGDQLRKELILVEGVGRRNLADVDHVVHELAIHLNLLNLDLVDVTSIG